MGHPDIAVIILAAGHGTRMKSSRPKVLHEIGRHPMLGHVIDLASSLSPSKIVVVTGARSPAIGEFAKSIVAYVDLAVQDPPQGTADAVSKALPYLSESAGKTVILYADTPLIETETLQSLMTAVSGDTVISVLGFTPDTPGAYGRLQCSTPEFVDCIIEAKDATAEELKISLCNSGVIAIDTAFLLENISKISNENAKGEYYLTDIVAIARKAGKRCRVITAEPEEVLGVNSRGELAIAESLFQKRMRTIAMASGVTLIDPESVFFSYDTQLGLDVIIEPNVVFGKKVEIGNDVEIKAHSHIEGAVIHSGATIGPFARLRPGTVLHRNAKIGNFVEIKNANVAESAKISHLSYIGDAEIGTQANIGAGTITCNYDGYGKHKTKIGANAFIGSNSSLVAPVTIGDGAYVGSGSVITKDIEPGDLGVARGRQATIRGWAAKFRAAHEKK